MLISVHPRQKFETFFQLKFSNFHLPPHPRINDAVTPLVGVCRHPVLLRLIIEPGVRGRRKEVEKVSNFWRRLRVVDVTATYTDVMKQVYLSFILLNMHTHKYYSTLLLLHSLLNTTSLSRLRWHQNPSRVRERIIPRLLAL